MNLPFESLSATDLVALESRWIDPATASRAQLYRVSSMDGGHLIGRNGSGDWSGLAIPNIFPGQSHAREFLLRLDHPELEQKPDGSVKPKARYLHPPGRGNLLYFVPATTSEQLQDTTLPVAIAEGPLKALALARLASHGVEQPRFLPVAINGCWGWRGTVAKTTGAGGARCDVKGTISDFDRIAWTGRTVYLIPDTNVNSNASVGAAWRELGKELEGRGARCATVTIPPEDGVNGIDDFLAHHGPEEALQLFEQAKPRSAAPAYHQTDLGNSQRLIHRHGDDLLYVPAWNQWAVWDGQRWKRDDLLEVQSRAKETVQSIYVDAGKLQDEAERKKLAAFAMASESASKIRAMLELARSEMAARAEDFDQDPDLLNFTNGVVYLPTAELRPHRREDRITKLVHFAYDPEARCPRFLAFLRQIMDDSDLMVQYLQIVMGYAVTGRTSEKAAFVGHGPGDNGKTTLLSTARELLIEYAVVLQVTSLMEQRFESSNAQADLADLQGARFAMTSETEEGQKLSASRVKRITQGMGSIRAVRKYQNPISFVETHKLFLDCNHKPRVKDDGRAIWNRLHLIPFTVTVPKKEQDPELQSKLLAEGPGILAWIVEGARHWYTEGLQRPPEVMAATEDWRKESDVIEAFLSECCTREKSGTIPKDKLYEKYRQWGEKSGERVETKRTFGKKLLDRGFDEYSDGKSRFWIGLGVIPDATDTTA